LAWVELALHQHLADIGGRRDLMDGDAVRRLEAGGAAMARFRRALHEKSHFARMHAEFMLEHAAGPDSGGLLIFGNADPLAAQILGLLDTGGDADQDAQMEELARREHRDGDPLRRRFRRRDGE
jgi:hypothetical protein